MTVVFLDLRGFTAFAETAEPGGGHGLSCASITSEMGKLILAHEGTLERFTGDGLMIFFNDPVPVPGGLGIRAARMARGDAANGLASLDGQLAAARIRSRPR